MAKLFWMFSTSLDAMLAKVFESVLCLCCLDVDECLAANGGCDHTCQNSAGSFQCFCRRGFRLDEDRQSCIREYRHQKQQTTWQTFLVAMQKTSCVPSYSVQIVTVVLRFIRAGCTALENKVLVNLINLVARNSSFTLKSNQNC